MDDGLCIHCKKVSKNEEHVDQFIGTINNVIMGVRKKFKNGKEIANLGSIVYQPEKRVVHKDYGDYRAYGIEVYVRSDHLNFFNNMLFLQNYIVRSIEAKKIKLVGEYIRFFVAGGYSDLRSIFSLDDKVIDGSFVRNTDLRVFLEPSEKVKKTDISGRRLTDLQFELPV
jgi:hypothetical protein